MTKLVLYDVFVSHASLDKSLYVEDLVKEMQKVGIHVFYDDESITWGDDIKEKIDEGLCSCRFALIVISQNYFGREWTEYELSSLLLRQKETKECVILPLLLNITKKDLIEHYPELGKIKFKYAKAQTKAALAQEIKLMMER